MHPQLGSMSERQQRRLHLLKECGCLACFLWFNERACPGGEGHHAEGVSGRAISHDAIIILCPWHHQGKPTNGENLVTNGPSRHRHAVRFAEEFGTDLELLKIQNEVFEKFLSTFLIRPNV